MNHLPPDPRTPTIPAPRDDDPMTLMRELRAALENAGSLMTELSTRLACIELAMLTEECQTHALSEKLQATDLRVAGINERLEVLEGMAAE